MKLERPCSSQKKRDYTGGIVKYLMVNTLLCFLLLFTSGNVLADFTQDDLRNAILGNGTFDEQTLIEMDMNADGKVDVADIVYFDRNKVMIESVETSSQVNEIDGMVTIDFNFSRAFTGTLYYAVGGTATSSEDYYALTGSIDVVNATNASESVTIYSDTEYEGDETIVLNLLPSESYSLGENKLHTVTIKDNINESSADYIFTIATETMGIPGDTTAGTGFPSTVLSRTASINITFANQSILGAGLNIAKSVGIADPKSYPTPISATHVSYSDGIIQMTFAYTSQYESFSSDPVLTSFDPNNPGGSYAASSKRSIENTLEIEAACYDIGKDGNGITIKTPVPCFDMTSQTYDFSNNYMEGTFLLQSEGILQEATTPFFNGKVVGTIQR